MKLGFYYHIAVVKKEDGLYLPGYLGLFLDALAANVAQLTLIMHEGNDAVNADYKLTAKNLDWVNLGLKTAAWHREIFHKRILSDKLKQVRHLDILLIRSPSPLAPYFLKHAAQRVVYFVVGDYRQGAAHMNVKGVRDMIVQLYLQYNDFRFKKSLSKTMVLVNSPELHSRYSGITPRIDIVKTTTLKKDELNFREDTCQNPGIKLLFTGRIDLAKGLMELVKAFVSLREKKVDASLHIVGWEDNPLKPVENALKKEISGTPYANDLVFHGRKKVGPELNKMYQMADIYVIPSYHEGFPRTIWEAMGQGTPVIATKVGAIPHFLSHETDVLLIEPKSVDAIEEAVIRIIRDTGLRRNLIKNGFDKASENTLEAQSEKLISILKSY